PDVLGLVLDPARRRKMLREFSLRDGRDGNVRSKHNGARGCGALIDGQHIGHDIFLALLPGMLAVRCCGKASGLAMVRQYGRRRACFFTHGTPPLPRLRGRVGVGVLSASGLAEAAPTRLALLGTLPRKPERAENYTAAG